MPYKISRAAGANMSFQWWFHWTGQQAKINPVDFFVCLLAEINDLLVWTAFKYKLWRGWCIILPIFQLSFLSGCLNKTLFREVKKYNPKLEEQVTRNKSIYFLEEFVSHNNFVKLYIITPFHLFFNIELPFASNSLRFHTLLLAALS